MSALELIVAYLRERARLRLLIPLSVLLALAGRWMISGSSTPIGATGLAGSQALGLVLAFRIWDDLEDRDVDRVRHPTRVLSATRRTAPLYALGVALALAAVLSLLDEPFALRRLAALSIATAILSVWYGVRPADGSRHALAEHVLATKYPIFAYAVAPGLPSDVMTIRIAIILGALYALICVYEYADDAELRQPFTSRRSAS